jgi:hypothetical protein
MTSEAGPVARCRPLTPEQVGEHLAPVTPATVQPFGRIRQAPE